MKREQALSEVIGFLMIVAVLTILFSMYLLYVVPLQGRDSEISHMNNVKEQFTGIVLDINSLIVNEKLNYPIQRTISLGSGEGGTTGAFSIFPMQTYSGSSGLLRVDTKNPSLGTITFILNGTAIQEIDTNGPNNPEYIKNDIIDPTESEISIDPQHFYLHYHVANSDDPANDSEKISLISANWSAIARVIPQYDPNFVNVTQNPLPGDLTLTIIKNGTISIDNLTIAKYIEKNKNYTINLYDWSYGLADSLKNTYNISYRVNELAEKGPFPIGQAKYSEMPIINVKPNFVLPPPPDTNELTHPLSIFEYRSNNKNWINQDYQYQWGAGFINQSDGTALMFPPPINIRMINGIINIDITDTIIETHNAKIPSSTISGTQNNPVIITLTELDNTLKEYELLDGEANARYFIMYASGFDNIEKEKWKRVFNLVAENAKRYSGGWITEDNIAVSETLNNGDPSVSLVIVGDGIDLSDFLDDENLTLNEVIGNFTNVNGSNYINNNNLKIDYKRAVVSISLYNVGQ